MQDMESTVYFKEEDLFCPARRIRANGAQIISSVSFTDRRNCKCKDSFFWNHTVCSPCPPRLQCDSNVHVRVTSHASASSIFSLRPSTLSPSESNVPQFNFPPHALVSLRLSDSESGPPGHSWPFSLSRPPVRLGASAPGFVPAIALCHAAGVSGRGVQRRRACTAPRPSCRGIGQSGTDKYRLFLLSGGEGPRLAAVFAVPPGTLFDFDLHPMPEGLRGRSGDCTSHVRCRPGLVSTSNFPPLPSQPHGPPHTLWNCWRLLAFLLPLPPLSPPLRGTCGPTTSGFSSRPAFPALSVARGDTGRRLPPFQSPRSAFSCLV